MTVDTKTKSSSQILSVYGYTNYRDYLRDYYQHRKESQRGYSFRQFSKDGGFTSPNILKLVMDGERSLSPESVEKFVKALRLEGSMADYFRALVKMNQSKDDEEKTESFQLLKKLIPSSKRRELSPETIEYLSHWLYPVLREMALTCGFRNDPYWISRRLTGRASPKEITKALRFLVKNGFIEQDAAGGYVAKDNMVVSSDEVRSLSIRLFHRTILEQSKEILEDLDMTEREYGALTFQLPGEKLEELKSKLKSFRKELHLWALEAADGKPADNVVQVNMQMYPQTKRTVV